MNEELLRIMVEKNLSLLETLISACMFWWVSSVVFCGSLLAGIWKKETEIKKMPIFHWFFFVATVFIGSVVCFGFCVVRTSFKLESETEKFLELTKMNIDALSGFAALREGMYFGTSSFVLVLITLVGMWVSFGKNRKTK